jgi:hypothetical protein
MIVSNDSKLLELAKLRKAVALKRENGLAFYRPHPKQEVFHKAHWAKLRYLRTGNRFGKSTAGTAEDCAWALGERPWISVDDPERHAGLPKRSTKGLIIVADWDKAREIYTSQEPGEAMGKLFKFLPKSSIQGIHKNQAGEIDCVMVKSVWGGTSYIYIDTVKSFKANPMGQESGHWDWIHVDEPCPKAMWIANSRGLIDNDGSAWFTCTPITEQWINELFVPRTRLRDEFPDGTEFPGKKWIMTGSSHDNITLTKEAIQRFADQLTPEEREARINGRPKTMQGVVYSQFDTERHVYHELPKGWEDFDSPPEDYTIRVAIDPHPKTPHAVLFAATAPTGQTFFYKEYFQHVMMDDLVDVVLSMLKGRAPQMIMLDRSAFNQDPITGACWADSFYQRGIPVVPASKELSHGIQAVQNALAKTKDDTLHFYAGLQETLYEFDCYIWDPAKENKPKDKNDHMMENLYRLVLSGLSYVSPEKTEPWKLSEYEFNGKLDIPKQGKPWFERNAS